VRVDIGHVRMAEQAAQLRTELAERDTAIDALRRQLDALEAAMPDMCERERGSNVPNYRELLDTSLAAANLVICQTGCISHQAYWRVKDFCKRTGKRCLFVDNPSTSSFSVCLRRVAEAAVQVVE